MWSKHSRRPGDPQTPRRRLALLLPLAAVIALAWVELLYLGWGMDHMDAGADMLLMPRMTDWQPADLALVFLMWTLMMVAMMLPSALPMLLAFDAERTRLPGRLHRARLELKSKLKSYIGTLK